MPTPGHKHAPKGRELGKTGFALAPKCIYIYFFKKLQITVEKFYVKEQEV
jgi:hypothetical protein